MIVGQAKMAHPMWIDYLLHSLIHLLMHEVMEWYIDWPYEQYIEVDFDVSTFKQLLKKIID